MNNHDAAQHPQWAKWIAAFLLLCFAIQSIASMRLFSNSSDELPHIVAGYSYLTTGDFRLNQQHPPFVKLLAALPLLALKPTLSTIGEHWKNADEWKLGFEFLYSNNADEILFWSRLPIVALSLLLGAVIYRWSSEMFGWRGGLLSTALFAFSPNLLAHSHFVTMDMAISFFATSYFYALWKYTIDLRRSWLIAAGLLLGLAMASKFSGGVLALTAPLLLLVARRNNERIPLTTTAIALAVMAALSLLVIWTLYFFPNDLLLYWNGLTMVQADHVTGYPWYLSGEFNPDGWLYYFPLAMVLKTPLPTQIAIVGSLIVFFTLRSERQNSDWFILLPIAVWLFVTIALANNLSLRYVLPVYPLLFVFVGRLGFLFEQARTALAPAALSIWLATTTLLSYPDYLAYFNGWTSGQEEPHRYLDDSNIDWGQDLKRLKSYLDANNLGKVKLLYTWNGSPKYYGIDYVPVSKDEWEKQPTPGVYVISTQALIRGLYFAKIRGVHTDWLNRYKPAGRVGKSFYIYRF